MICKKATLCTGHSTKQVTVHSVLSNTLYDMSYRIGNRIFAIEAWDLLTAILYFVKKSK